MRRRTDQFTQELVLLQYDHALENVTFAEKIMKVKQAMRIDLVQYINPTGYVQDATNYYVLGVKKGADVAASWSLLTGAEGTIAADTFVDFTLSGTDANLVCAAGDIISWCGTKVLAGADVPVGRLVIHGRYL
jgi:hypothetical protein